MSFENRVNEITKILRSNGNKIERVAFGQDFASTVWFCNGGAFTGAQFTRVFNNLDAQIA